jgi:hypothetical protein
MEDTAGRGKCTLKRLSVNRLCRRPYWEAVAARQCVAGKRTFNPPPQRLAGNASRLERIPGIVMPRECPLASRNEHATAGTDSTKRRSARLPIAIAPARCHVQCCASQAKARCGGHTDLGGLLLRHNHCRLTRTRDDGAVVRALPVSREWHQPEPALAASHYDWPQ